MISNTTRIGAGPEGSRRSTGPWLAGALTLVASAATSWDAAAQDTSELGRLIFEPVLLSAARASPIDLEDRPSTPDTEALASSVTVHLGAIESLRQADERDPALVDELGLLAVAYQSLDRYEEALEALDEAISLTRRASGRNNVDQIPLQEQKIPSYLALGDTDSVDDTEELIYSLKERSLSAGSREMYYATINLADWYTTAYYRENFAAGNRTLQRQRGVIPRVQRCISIPGSSPGQESSGCLENPIFTGEIKDVYDQDINDVRLRKIDRLYGSYQNALKDSGYVQLDIIMDLAKRIARLSYATKQEMDFERDNYHYDPNYDGSREQAYRNSSVRMDESYLTGEKALKYAIEFPSSVASFRPEALAALLLDLGDWRLAYGKAAAAEEAYAEAYRTLLEAGFTAENVDLALRSDLPIQIPLFATHLYTRRSNGMSDDAELRFRGYVDVGYTVDNLGNAADLEFLGRSSEDSPIIERLLESQFKSIKFRPVLRGGELTGPGRIEARYYYSY